MINLQALSEPFPPDKVSWRVGSTTQDKKRGLALAYIDARDVMERLDAVCGPGNWQCRYPHANGKTCCEIGIRVEADWVWKANGAGDTDVEKEKGAFSDAFKRAAVLWGIGRYLYDFASPWVELEAAGKSHKITDRELSRLRGLLGRSSPNGPAKPDERPMSEIWTESAVKDIAVAPSVEVLADWWRVNASHIDALPDNLQKKVVLAKDLRKSILIGGAK